MLTLSKKPPGYIHIDPGRRGASLSRLITARPDQNTENCNKSAGDATFLIPAYVPAISPLLLGLSLLENLREREIGPVISSIIIQQDKFRDLNRIMM